MSVFLKKIRDLSIHTIDRTVNSNSVIGVATDALKAFVKADTGSTGGFTIEAMETQSGTTVDTRFFSINEKSGEIRLANGIAELDFEDKASFTGDNNYEFNPSLYKFNELFVSGKGFH